MSLITVKNNECCICHEINLSWNLIYSKSHVEMFKCGHGTCKKCYNRMQQSNQLDNKCFSCPLCRAGEQEHTIGFMSSKTEKWTIFAEWYNDFEVYIKSGNANNVIKIQHLESN
jgi:hypothetical protein